MFNVQILSIPPPHPPLHPLHPLPPLPPPLLPPRAICTLPEAPRLIVGLLSRQFFPAKLFELKRVGFSRVSPVELNALDPLSTCLRFSLKLECNVSCPDNYFFTGLRRITLDLPLAPFGSAREKSELTVVKALGSYFQDERVRLSNVD